MYVRKYRNKWRAEIEVTVNSERIRESRSFSVKAEAIAWANEREQELLNGGNTNKVDYTKTLLDALEYYYEYETPKKTSGATDQKRINRIISSGELNLKIKLNALDADYFESYINKRLEVVMTSTVNREMSLFRAVLKVAKRKNWINHNPFEHLSDLPEPPARNRRISESEVERILESLNYSDDCVIKEARQKVAVMFLLALETGMRIGEICNLEWDDVFLDQSYLIVRYSKNSDVREVPLSSRAIELIKKMTDISKSFVHKRTVKDKYGRVKKYLSRPIFAKNLNDYAGPASSLFRKYVEKALIDDLTFHDTRHEACTRLARKIDVLDLAKMIGHRDLNSLMIYYNPTATEIANRLG